MNTKSDFIVKINDSHCEWEFGFNAYDKSIQNFVDAITDKLGIKCNYQKLIVSNEELKANKGVNISFDCKSSNDLKSESLKKEQEPTNPLDDLPIIGDGVLMEVSDDEEDWYKAEVYCKIKDTFIAYLKANDSINQWQHARPITSKTKITRKEFESKFEIID
jgi:hypothetical protein